MNGSICEDTRAHIENWCPNQYFGVYFSQQKEAQRRLLVVKNTNPTGCLRPEQCWLWSSGLVKSIIVSTTLYAPVFRKKSLIKFQGPFEFWLFLKFISRHLIIISSFRIVYVNHGIITSGGHKNTISIPACFPYITPTEIFFLQRR